MQEVRGGSGVFKEELDRLLASTALRNADSLRRLLAYLAEAFLAGKSRDIKEYMIGRDVMGKPENYDPRVDASVRVQIGKLRQRIELYYTSEAPHSLWQISLPKGHFEIEFREHASVPAAAVPRNRGDIVWKSLAAAFALLSLGLAIWVFSLRNQTPRTLPRPEWTPEMAQFWGPFVQSNKTLTVVLGSPLFVRFHNSYFRHPLVNDWPAALRDLPLEEMRKLLKNPTPASETHRWAPFGEAVAAFRLASILSHRKHDMTLKRSSVLSWEDLKASNLVFLGPRKFNPQISELPIDQDFDIDRGAVHNLRIRPGERATYSKAHPSQHRRHPRGLFDHHQNAGYRWLGRGARPRLYLYRRNLGSSRLRHRSYPPSRTHPPPPSGNWQYPQLLPGSPAQQVQVASPHSNRIRHSPRSVGEKVEHPRGAVEFSSQQAHHDAGRQI